MRTLGVNFRTSRMVTEVNSSFLQVGIVAPIVLDFDDYFTAVNLNCGASIFATILKAASFTPLCTIISVTTCGVRGWRGQSQVGRVGAVAGGVGVARPGVVKLKFQHLDHLGF